MVPVVVSSIRIIDTVRISESLSLLSIRAADQVAAESQVSATAIGFGFFFQIEIRLTHVDVVDDIVGG